MKLGPPIDLTPEEVAYFEGPPRALVPLLGEPIDPLDDFDLYQMIEDEKEKVTYIGPKEPGLPEMIWEGVTGLVSNVAEGVGEVAKNTAKVQVGLMGGALDDGKMAKEGMKNLAALGSATAAQVMGNVAKLGGGIDTVLTKAKAGIGALWDPLTEAKAKESSRRASWQLARDNREIDTALSGANERFWRDMPKALKSIGQIPVNPQAVEGLAAIADPSNFIPFGQGLKLARAPLKGAMNAGASALKEEAFAVAKLTAQQEALTLSTRAARGSERLALEAKLKDVASELTQANGRHVSAKETFSKTLEREMAALPVEPAPAVNQAAGAASQPLGQGLEQAGGLLSRIAELPQAAALKFAPDNLAAQEGIRNVVGGLGIVPASTALILSLIHI
jgi:hypothetical protein